jgi:Arabinose-binding domain of AraC transcription regulator, N-term
VIPWLGSSTVSLSAKVWTNALRQEIDRSCQSKKSTMQEATFSVAIVRDIVQYVADQGVSVQDLYRVAQIDPSWLDDPDRQVAGEVLKSLWREAITQTGDCHLGLHIGEAFDLLAIGIVGYVLLNCKTYGQVLEKLSQYRTHLTSLVDLN